MITLKKIYITIGICIILIFFFGNIFDFVQSFEYKALDSFRTKHSPHPEIVIVAIDNQSIQSIGRFPWDRSVYADFINKVTPYNPRLLAYDINFSEKQNDFEDSQFRNALLYAKFPTLLSTEAIYFKGSKEPQEILKPSYFLDNNKNTYLAHVNVFGTEDGIMRNFPKYLNIKGEEFTPFSFKIGALLGADIPQNSSKFLIDFAGGAGTFTTIPFEAILNQKVGKEYLEDKILLVGATASDLRDYLLAPVQGQVLSGVEWHANVLDNILLNKHIEILPIYMSALLGVLLSLILLFLPTSIKTSRLSILFVLLLIFLPVFSLILWRQGFAFFFFGNMLSISSTFLVRSAYIWYVAEQDKRRLHKTIQNRFSPQVVDAILKDPALLKLGGVRKEVTVFFSDIRSFTTISESITPEQLSELLHEYFTEMAEEVLATDGVLDKFIGDAVMAFWGAPIDQDDQADRAVKASLGMLRRLKILQEKWKGQGLPFVDIGIGIHTGLATVGNMGSEKRFDYTVIGDTVNIASRLEGLNKEYKTHLIVSEETLSKLKMKVESKPLGEVLVKGKTKPVNIYQIIE